MQRMQHHTRNVWLIIALSIALLSAATIPVLAYTVGSTYSTKSSASNGGYYSTKYGWVGNRPATGTSPVYRPSTPTTPAPQTPTQPSNPGGVAAEEAQMVSLVNQERAKAGLAPLTVQPQLVEIARIKSQDMIAANYFGHKSPNFGSTFNLVKQRGLSYSAGGENLAGAGNVTTAHRMLMDSPGHRANILNANFTRIGIGIVRGGPYGAMYTQLFLGR